MHVEMTYYVIGQDGHRYGPADLTLLSQWVREGRVLPATIIEDATSGTRIPASSVPGLAISPPSMSPPPGSQPGTYQPYSSYGQARPASDGSGDVTSAWVLGVIGLLCCPVVPAIVGIILAVTAKNKGAPGAQAAMAFCITVLVLNLGAMWFMNSIGDVFPF
jgi:hypothetical protein